MGDLFPLMGGGRSHFQASGAGSGLETGVKGNPIRSLAGHVVLFGFRWNSPNETPVNEKRAELSVCTAGETDHENFYF